MKTYAIILAAGKGTRMKTDTPKALFPVLYKPLVEHVIEEFERSDYIENILLIVGHKKEEFYEFFKDRVIFAEQKEQKGTGDAVKSAIHLLDDPEGQTIIVPGDVPLMTASLIDDIMKTHQEQKNDLTVGTMRVDDPFGYGRILRDKTNNIIKIIEHKNCQKEEMLIDEVNTSIYVINNKALLENINKIKPNDLTGEYYLTDLVEIMNKDYKIGSYLIEDHYQTSGINNLYQLSEVEEYLKDRIRKNHQLNGVEIYSPQTVSIGIDVKIESGVTIKQNTIIKGNSVIKEGSIIGPNTTIDNSIINEDVIIEDSVITNSTIERKCYIGPFAHIRDNSLIGENTRIGNFTEVKNSKIGKDSFASHHSYIGDAIVGKRANFGSGSVIVNFDGIDKHQTIIGDDVFIGCNVNIIAPIVIKDKVVLAAGSTITDDVKEGSLAIARSRQIEKPDYYKKFKKSNKK